MTSGLPANPSLRRAIPGRVGDRLRSAAVLATICVLTAVVYGQVRGHEFVNYDDPLYVSDNAHVRAGLTRDSVTWAFTNTISGSWHPVAWLSHLVDARLFGMHPGAHHLTSAGLHAANALLLFWLLRAMTGALWRSAAVAALFAVHPLHVESVAWLAERKDVLSTFLGGLSIAAWISHLRRRGARAANYLASLVLFALALMAKPMVVTLPFLLLLLDYWPLSRLSLGGAAAPGHRQPTPARLFLEKIPFFALSVMASVAAYLSQAGIGAVASAEAYPLGERLANVLTSYATYLARTLAPVNLAVYYPRSSPPSAAGASAALALLALLTALAARGARRRPAVVVGWFWYLVALVPVIGLVRVGEQATADRYAYVPVVGLFIVLAWGLTDALRGRRRALLASAGAVAVVALTAAARVQTGYWKDSVTLFEHCLEATRGNWMAYVSLGEALQERGRTEEARRMYAEALRIRPLSADAHNNLGILLASEGRLSEAVTHYVEALRIRPRWETHNNLGLALASMGRLPEAVEHFTEAVRGSPPSVEPYLNLGLALVQSGKPGEAEVLYRRALGMDPASVRGHHNLGALLAGESREDEAIEHLQRALQLDPGNPLVRKSLRGAVLSKARRPAPAAHD